MRKSFSRLKASFGSAGQNGHTASSDQQPAESHHPACPPKPDTAATNEKTRPERQPKPASGSAAQPTAKPVNKAKMEVKDFFTEYGEANRYAIKEVIGKGSYGVVCSAVDTKSGEKVAIKKINNVFDHVSDATRILREIKLLRLLRHPDIVEIKHIMLPPSPREFKDIYVVFELMETDLHQVIKANDDLTPEHHQFFLYQMLRGLKYIHTAKVYHRDLKPKNILANSDCKLKVCDFGLARPSFNDMPTTIFWTDYVATRWYRAPELCGSFFAKYSPAIDIWSIGCIFAEILLGKPLFPGRNVVHQLELITDLLGTPSSEVIAKVRNEKARRFLLNMRKKPGVNFTTYFPRADPGAIALLRRMLSFDPADRPTSEAALADPYFAGLSQPAREPSAQPVSKLAFEFERRKLQVDEVRDLIYREILEYHPQMLADHLSNGMSRGANFMYPSAVDNFRRQFAHLEGGGAPGKGPNLGQATSLPRERVKEFQHEAQRYMVAGQQPPMPHGQGPMMPPQPTAYPGIPPGMPAPGYGVVPGTDMRSLNSGVANMTVDENGGFVPATGQVPVGHLPPGMTPQQYAQQQYAQRYAQQNAHLLRSNSYQ